MSASKSRQVRKQINNLIKQKTMDNKVNMSLQQLETYVQLSVFLTGSKPITIELNPTYYNFYVQEVQRQAEAMGLKPGFNEDKPTFLGIELTKKIEIVVADTSGTVTK